MASVFLKWAYQSFCVPGFALMVNPKKEANTKTKSKQPGNLCHLYKNDGEKK